MTSFPRAAGRLLQVKHLRTQFFTDAGVVKAVEDVSFLLSAGETLAVVGESGSGKSVTSLSIMGLIPNPPGRIVGGEILFRTREGTVVDLAKLPASKDLAKEAFRSEHAIGGWAYVYTIAYRADQVKTPITML